MSDIFIDVETGMNYTTMKDEHEIIKIVEKNATVGNIGEIVQGEINSQEIEFSIPRYYDNVDLLDKDFKILFETKGGIFKADAIDKSYNDTEIRFNWLMDENATMYSGQIKAVVMIKGKDEQEKDYVFKTMNFTVNVKEALCEYGADGVYHTWATDIEERISQMESISSSQNTFVGTSSDYEAAVGNGEIQNGMLITITDA